MRLKVNRSGVQIECRAPNGGFGTFPLFGRARPLWTLRRIPHKVRAARAWQARGEIVA